MKCAGYLSVFSFVKGTGGVDSVVGSAGFFGFFFNCLTFSLALQRCISGVFPACSFSLFLKEGGEGDRAARPKHGWKWGNQWVSVFSPFSKDILGALNSQGLCGGQSFTTRWLFLQHSLIALQSGWFHTRVRKYINMYIPYTHSQRKKIYIHLQATGGI